MRELYNTFWFIAKFSKSKISSWFMASRFISILLHNWAIQICFPLDCTLFIYVIESYYEIDKNNLFSQNWNLMSFLLEFNELSSKFSTISLNCSFSFCLFSQTKNKKKTKFLFDIIFIEAIFQSEFLLVRFWNFSR